MIDAGALPNGDVHTNERGGMQSALEGRYDLIPGEALTRLAKVVAAGAKKYAPNNWRAIAYKDHISHAVMHLAAMLSDDQSDDHLGHALCRLAFAVAVEDSQHQFTSIETGAAEV